MTKKQRILSLTAALLLPVILAVAISLVLTEGRALAWFSKVRDNEEKGLDMRVDYEDIEVTGLAFTYDIYGEKLQVTDDFAEMVFNPYDQIFLSRNRYTPVLFKLTLKGKTLGESGSVTVSVEREQPTDSSGTLVPEDTLAPYVSSVFAFAATSSNALDAFDVALIANGATDEEKQAQTAVNAGLYNAASELFNPTAGSAGTAAAPEKKVFTTVTSGTSGTVGSVEKTKKISFANVHYGDTSKGEGVPAYDAETGIYTVDIYVFVSYDAALVDSFAKVNTEGSGLGLNSTNISLGNDLTFLVIEKESN